MLKLKYLFSIILLSPFSVFAQESLKVTVPENVDSYDASETNSQSFRDTLYGNVYETLVTLDHKGKPQPKLATSWKLNFDKSELTFFLRKDVVFHDGSSFNCKDVQRMILRRPSAIDRAFRNFNMPVVSKIKRASCSSQEEVRIELLKPYMYAIEDFASFRMSLFKELGDDFKKDYAGTGPYKLINNSEGGKPSDVFQMEVFKEYWGDERPDIELITIQTEPDDSKAIAMVLNGDTDIAMNIQNNSAINNLIVSADFETRRNNVRLRYGLLEDKLIIELNHKKPLMNRVDFRCGLYYALNQQILNDQIFYGKAQKLYSAQSVYHPRYQTQLQKLKHKDVSSSKVFLSQFTSNERSEPRDLLIVDTPQNRAIAENFTKMLREVEIFVQIRALNYDAYRKSYYQDEDFDMVLVNHPEANMIAHYLLSESLYGFDGDTFSVNLEHALNWQDGDVVSEARITSTLKYQYLSCQQFFLLQKPIFYLTGGRKWNYPNLNRPSGGFDFAAMTLN